MNSGTPPFMSDRIQIAHYPVFKKNLFKRNPALFAPFYRNTPKYKEKKYEQRQKTISQFEEKIIWHLVTGPGFCGATHPGAGKTFHGFMTGSNHPVYDSDCLYVNPAQHIFGISDSPGMTTFSRKLFDNIDHRMRTKPNSRIIDLINQLNRKTKPDERATLALIYFEEHPIERSFNKAFTLIAGDTCIFHGNIHRQGLVRVSGHDAFFGRMHSHMEPLEIPLSKGDFFIIASDGIASVRPVNQEAALEDVLWHYLQKDMNYSVFDITRHCNRIIEDEGSEQTRAWFRGNDDISLLIVYPDEFRDTNASGSVILGGYVMGATLSRVDT